MTPRNEVGTFLDFGRKIMQKNQLHTGILVGRAGPRLSRKINSPKFRLARINYALAREIPDFKR